jgi:DNA-binding NtrC family response regulator
MAEELLNIEAIRHLFVIDDDAMQREMMGDYFKERYLFDVKKYQDGESALEDIKNLKPEIIVLDYHLNAQNNAAKNGIAILQEIKTSSPNTAVIMFTGEDNLEIALDSMRNGAFDYVVKGPSAFNKIEKVINTLGERHKLEAINVAQRRTISFLVGVIFLIIAGALMYFLKGN